MSANPFNPNSSVGQKAGQVKSVWGSLGLVIAGIAVVIAFLALWYFGGWIWFYLPILGVALVVFGVKGLVQRPWAKNDPTQTGYGPYAAAPYVQPSVYGQPEQYGQGYGPTPGYGQDYGQPMPNYGQNYGATPASGAPGYSQGYDQTPPGIGQPPQGYGTPASWQQPPTQQPQQWYQPPPVG